MKIIRDIQQGTPEWFQARAGKPTASGFSKLITTKGAPSKSAEGYMNQLIGERILGTSDTGGYTNAAMQRGTDLEPEARAYFEMIKGVDVVQVGLVLTNSERSSCSPDGLIFRGKTLIAGLEIKCPSLAVHVGYLRDGGLPYDYFQQVHGSIWTCGVPWWFMSYYPGVDPFIINVTRNKEFCSALDIEIPRFCDRLDYEFGKLSCQK